MRFNEKNIGKYEPVNIILNHDHNVLLSIVMLVNMIITPNHFTTPLSLCLREKIYVLSK